MNNLKDMIRVEFYRREVMRYGKFVESDHPRDDGGKFSSGEGGGLSKRQAKKINISQAAGELKKLGIKLLGGTQPKIVDGKHVTQYRIEEDGKERIATAAELQGILSGKEKPPTEKKVKPSEVSGATKRMSDLIFQAKAAIEQEAEDTQSGIDKSDAPSRAP